jgi:hypothetical protein
MQGKVGLYAYISPMWGVAPSQPIVTMFDKFSGLANVINWAKFQNNRPRDFVRRVPEARMFSWESQVILNTVLSANALARDDC